MRSARIRRVRVFLLVTVCVLGSIPGRIGWAEDLVLLRGPLATVKSGPNGIVWDPHIEYERLVLTVKTPGKGVIRKEFAPAQKPLFSGPFTDGQYTFELRVVPIVAPEVREALKKARATGDMSRVEQLRRRGALPQGPQVQSGYFRIHGGAVITTQVEPPYGRKNVQP